MYLVESLAWDMW